MQWEIQQAEAIPVKTQAFDTHSIFDRGRCCPARSETSRAKGVDSASSLCISGLCVVHCIQVNMQTIVIFLCCSTWHGSNWEKSTRYRWQRTEISYNWKYFPQSRRFCIISYKSPIQTELMEYMLKQPPPPWPLNSHANKMYKYKEEENCKVHSLAGMGCWNISKVLQKCESCNYGLDLLCGGKFIMFISDGGKKSTRSGDAWKM